MSVILFFSFTYTSLCILSPFFVSIRHRYINVDVPNIHTHVSAVHSVSGAVSLVFVSDWFAITKLCSEGRLIFFTFLGCCCCTGSVSVLHVAQFECQDVPNVDRSQTKQ